MFQDAIHALSDALKDVAGELVFYQSAGSGVAFSIVAVPGRSMVTVERDHGAVIDVLSHDWTIDVDDLAAANGGQPYTPAKGDTITRRRPSGTDDVYRLMNPPWKPADSFMIRMRLHSVKVAS